MGFGFFEIFDENLTKRRDEHLVSYKNPFATFHNTFVKFNVVHVLYLNCIGLMAQRSCLNHFLQHIRLFFKQCKTSEMARSNNFTSLFFDFHTAVHKHFDCLIYQASYLFHLQCSCENIFVIKKIDPLFLKSR